MGLFKGRFAGRGARTSGEKRKTDPGRPTQEGKRPRGARAAPRAPHTVLRFFAWLLVGIAVMAGGGYLVAALWLFPAPLLPSERIVPRVIGMSEREATRQLQQLGFQVQTASEPHPTSGAGLVTWQDPPPGVAAPRDTELRLTVSSGTSRARVPDVAGLDLMMAARLLAAVGLRLEGVDTAAVKGRMPGIAVGSTPAAGDSVPLGRGVVVHLAR